MERNYRFDTGYEYMWSLVEDIPTDEIKDEMESLKNKSKDSNEKGREIQRYAQKVTGKLSVLKKIIERRENAILAKTKPTEDHKKLLKRMTFEELKDGGDYVFIGCDGKRPFGNSHIRGDVAETLGWKLPNDDLSEEQVEKADKLLKELPFVINNIFKKL